MSGKQIENWTTYLGIVPEKHHVISLVGAGGKTTLIFTLAKELKEAGFRVAERLEKMGIAKGIELGREEGKAEEKKASRVEFILRVLEIKGTVDEKIRKRIEEEQDVDLLDNWLTNALKANTVQEFEQELN